MLIRWAAGTALLACCALAAACGSDSSRAPATAAQPYSAKDPSSGLTSRVTPVNYVKPIAAYRRHSRLQLGAMLADVGQLRSAAAANDLPAAKAAWLRADRRYETIGAAYGAFGELDRRINGTTAGLKGGQRSAEFTGLHKIELELWGRHSARAAAPAAAVLVGDIERLRAHIAKRFSVDPLDYSLRAHEVLEDSLHVQLAGQASPWSSSALNALEGNIDGTRVVLRTLAPMIEQRDPQVLADSRRALSRLERAVQGTKRDGALPRWDRLSTRDRERVAGLTAAAAERLAFVPELIDPRPPRPSQLPTGGTG